MSGEDLVGALNGVLSRSSSLKFTGGSGSAAATVAVLSHSGRFVNVLESRGSYLLSFHVNGRQQAHGLAPDISSAADSARRWVEGSGLERLAAAHPFVEFSGLQLAYERGTAVEFQWAALLESVVEEQDAFRDLVVLASRDSFLKRLFPHLGHRFALSADEYTDNILVAVFVGRSGRFVVFNDNDSIEFEGDAPQTIDYLVNRLHDQVS